MTDLPNAASVALVRNGKVLLIKRAFPPYQHLWTFPGGRLEPGETIEQCVIREVKEELGLAVRNPQPVLVQQLGGGGTYQLAVFVSSDFSGTIMPSSEIADHKWVDPAALPAFRTTTRLDDVIRQCLAVLAG
ncbi:MULTISPECIES: NUDIX domain-containing protein [unclassified Devosia]|jgi:mutator protein MutT|uniref:NUDIX hydrolase n=1 Tax=unclassified Devosia TaxID=196773 RepID=UPI001556E87D|nr:MULTISPECIES: NUDIX domain-containing protein [unclassified Devosia]